MVRVSKKKTANTKGRHRKVSGESIISAAKDSQISRLAARAGIARLGIAREIARGYMKLLLQQMINTAIHVTEYMRRKTVSGKDVDVALALHGITNVNGTRKGKAAFDKYSAPKGGARKKRNAIANPEAGETFIFDREPFKVLCKDLAREYNDEILLSSDSYDILQILAESQLDKAFRTAAKILKNKNRETLDHKTTHLAFNLSMKFSIISTINLDVNIPHSHIREVLAQVHADKGATNQAVEEMSSLVSYVAGNIMTVANALLLSSGKKTVTSREISTGVRIAFPGELMKNAVSESTKALTRFNAGLADRTPQSGQSRAGITFSVSRAKKGIRAASIGRRVGAGPAPYLAATLEYICREIWQLAGDVAHNFKKVRITPLAIRLAVKRDYELPVLFSSTIMSVVNDLPVEKASKK